MVVLANMATGLKRQFCDAQLIAIVQVGEEAADGPRERAPPEMERLITSSDLPEFQPPSATGQYWP